MENAKLMSDSLLGGRTIKVIRIYFVIYMCFWMRWKGFFLCFKVIKYGGSYESINSDTGVLENLIDFLPANSC